jgi:hypothetical protein
LKTQKERAEQRRREKLDLIRDQIEEGTLTIRKMTPEERAAHPARAPGDKPRRR